ncbi:DUF3592 domain-containing protein [Amycolatopsis sp. CA-230715]|uniref:DUF3592 domain-containing protein n=1 Tax=Amycolatopsis sp. CA-230715 TaxID=2745196 RepID=UPI001C00C0E2|nr:DUF3592 domain-containing protein [Amycolatopsis sp. CA-230715]QWF85537.1 hypothetical protein HUW46_08992 [Amycolatopsis sp. CA-230715]
MPSDRVIGLLLLVLGAAVTGLSCWGWRRLLARRAARVPVTVDASGALVPSIRFDDGGRPTALNPGDELEVVLRRAGTARLYRPGATGSALGFAVTGAVLLLTGAAVLALGFSEPVVRQQKQAVGLAVAVTGLCCFGALGAALVACLVRELPGSAVVDGVVTDVRTVPGRKTTHQPLVRYRAGDEDRRVWATPRWRRPSAGDRVRVRVAATSPREVVRTTPLALAGLVIILAFGALGVTALVTLWSRLG